MPKIYIAEVLVLSKTKLGESDLILTLLTSDNSQIRAVAKGARKPGAKLCGITESFTVFTGKFHSGKNLDILTEAKTIESYSDVRDNYDKILAGYVALELAAQVSNDGDIIPRLYEMMRAYLLVLSNAEDTQQQLLLTAFLLKLNALIGYSPEYELCERNPRLAVLLRTPFADVSGLADQHTISDLRTTMNFTQKHLPANLRALSVYRKSL